MLIEVLIIYILYSRIKKRKIFNLSELEFKGIYLVLLGGIVQLLPLMIVYFTSSSHFLSSYYKYLHIIGYILVGIFILLNRDKFGFKAIGLGIFLNFLPILFNGGYMPVSLRALRKAGLTEKLELIKRTSLTHGPIKNDTKFILFSDIIYIARPYIFPKVISIGDLIMGAGLLYFLVSYTEKD